MPFHPPPVTTPTIACKPAQQPSRAATFATLPEEIVIKILECCDFKGVLACQLTCHVLRVIIACSTSLRYKLALSEHGMCDGTLSDLITAEKLELLTAHTNAWGNLEKASREKADILMGWGVPIAVSCNVMVFSREGRWPGNPRREDGVLLPLEPCLDLLVLRVPSALRRVEAAHWVLPLPVDTGEVCIDASQDVLIYLRDDTFHACTLSTGAVHPLAEHGGSFRSWNGSWRFDPANICMCGDFVAATTRSYFISVWNWKTGQFVSDKLSEVHFSSYEFLDEHHILYASSHKDSIYVYDLRRGQQQEQEQPQKEKKGEIGRVRFQLDLPPIDSTTTLRYIYLRRNALPSATGNQPLPDGSLPSDSESPSAPATPPFYADPQERLIAMCITTSPVEWGEEQFELHVPARAFLDHISSTTTTETDKRNRQGDSGECKGEVVVPWSAWGNAVRATPSRKLPYCAVQPRMIVYGMRAVSYPPAWDAGVPVLHVDSYLPRARKREGGGSEVGVSGTRQAIKLPREVGDKPDCSVLCEDALLCYKESHQTRSLLPFFSTVFLMDLLQVDPPSKKISNAYWYTF